jgi:hypothetical protein
VFNHWQDSVCDIYRDFDWTTSQSSGERFPPQLYDHRKLPMYVSPIPKAGSCSCSTALTTPSVVLSVLGASALVIMILVRYAESKRLINIWKVQYLHGQKDMSGVNATTRSVHIGRRLTTFGKSTAQNGIDTWLVIRLTFSLVMLW